MGVSLSKAARRRYAEAIGPFNQRVSIRGHNFVFLDAPGLVDEDYMRSARGVGFDEWTPIPDGPVEFVRSTLGGEIV